MDEQAIFDTVIRQEQQRVMRIFFQYDPVNDAYHIKDEWQHFPAESLTSQAGFLRAR